MRFTLLRNATAVLEIGGQRLLIDPALDPAEAWGPLPLTPNRRPNPRVDLPEGWRELIGEPDAVVVTHLHPDHFDAMAERELDRDRPLFCQTEDLSALRKKGFTALQPVDREAAQGDVTLQRTTARHGVGIIGLLMGSASGFVFTAPEEPRVYLTGDTVWHEEVEEVLATHRPHVVVVNAGGARFLLGHPIVMTAEDIARVHKAAPDSVLIVVHLEAINHCLETRQHYRETLPELGVNMGRVRIPADGETVTWESI